MNDMVFRLEHSVEVAVSSSFAWKWRTDVRNWDDPPATFQLDGPFASGVWGTTRFPEQAPLRWRVREVRPEVCFVIAMPLQEAELAFEWRFEALSESRTRITQRVVLSGAKAGAYEDQVRTGFGANLADGMKRIAEAMEKAERSTQRRSS
jgi:hypothetical protein